MNFKIFCDGGARGNPGPAASAFVVYDDAGNLRDKRGNYHGRTTNNQAEYGAVIEALRWIEMQVKAGSDQGEARIEQVRFFLDSNLVVNQLNGLFKVKDSGLQERIVEVRVLEQSLSPINISYSYIPRARNWEADLLVNETLDRQKFS